jgi:hypothetical protein
MIGAIRSGVSFFMNRFRKLGFVEYNGRIKVHKSLLNAVLLGKMPELDPERPMGSAMPRSASKPGQPSAVYVVQGTQRGQIGTGKSASAHLFTHRGFLLATGLS